MIYLIAVGADDEKIKLFLKGKGRSAW